MDMHLGAIDEATARSDWVRKKGSLQSIRRFLLLNHHKLAEEEPDAAFKIAITVARICYTVGYIYETPPEEARILTKKVIPLLNRWLTNDTTGTTSKLSSRASTASAVTLLLAALLAAYKPPRKRPSELRDFMSELVEAYTPRGGGNGSGDRREAAPMLLHLAQMYNDQLRLVKYIQAYSENSVNAVNALNHCMGRKPDHVSFSNQAALSRKKKSRVAKVHRNKVRAGGLRLGPFLDSSQLRELNTFIECVQRVTPSAIHKRSFGDGNYGKGQKVRLAS